MRYSCCGRIIIVLLFSENDIYVTIVRCCEIVRVVRKLHVFRMSRNCRAICKTIAKLTCERIAKTFYLPDIARHVRLPYYSHTLQSTLYDFCNFVDHRQAIEREKKIVRLM